MTKFNSNVVLLSNAITSHKAGVKFETKSNDIKAVLDDLNSNKEKHFVDRTIWAVLANYNNTGQNAEYWKEFESSTSGGTKKVTSAFVGRFKTANPDCACTVDSPESIKATYKNMVATFEDLELDTMKAIKEYGKAVYELSPEAQSNVEMFAKIAISKDGFLNEDQHEDLLADLIKVAEKHEKKNQ
tara:strand:+ start:108 stop:665 length:558 start_codon:yes stop_codon:yes gene_type:complete